VKLRRVASYLLLFSFFVLLTPRDLWHDCDHDHSVQSSHEKKIDKDDCFACDYGLGVIAATSDFNHIPFYNKLALKNNLVESHLSDERFYLFLHRGPPQA
jgi:hypothetical protein